MLWSMLSAVNSFLEKGKKRESEHDYPESYLGSFQVTVPEPQDFKEIWENVAVTTRHLRFA